MLTLVQQSLYCPCGRPPVTRGLCATCYVLRRRDQQYFGGLRERVLERDGHLCRGCGLRPDLLGVHHRKPGISILRYMVALCPACHPRVHHTLVLRRAMSPQLRALWREFHPHAHEQIQLAFDAPPPAVVQLAMPLLWAA